MGWPNGSTPPPVVPPMASRSRATLARASCTSNCTHTNKRRGGEGEKKKTESEQGNKVKSQKRRKRREREKKRKEKERMEGRKHQISPDSFISFVVALFSSPPPPPPLLLLHPFILLLRLLRHVRRCVLTWASRSICVAENTPFVGSLVGTTSQKGCQPLSLLHRFAFSLRAWLLQAPCGPVDSVRMRVIAEHGCCSEWLQQSSDRWPAYKNLLCNNVPPLSTEPNSQSGTMLSGRFPGPFCRPSTDSRIPHRCLASDRWPGPEMAGRLCTLHDQHL